MKESNIVLCGHGSGRPSTKNMETYLTSRYALKASNGKRKGVVSVVRVKGITSAGMQAFHDFYKTLIGRNVYSQSLRNYVFNAYKDGKYYSDCSSSGCACYQKAGYGVGMLNTAGMYNSSNFEKVPVKIENGHITNPEILQVADALLFVGDDPSRPLQIGHVEFVYEISGAASGTSSSSSKAETSGSDTKVDPAKSYDPSLAGTYAVNTKTDPLNLRAGAGTNKTKISSLAKGSKVQCYGYYTAVSGTKWLLVVANGKTGFACSTYLKKS